MEEKEKEIREWVYSVEKVMKATVSEERQAAKMLKYLLSIIDSLRGEVERLNKIEKKWNILKLNYTCYSCKSESNCPSAWDGYNTSGDCLEEK